ncbi:MAG: hypothetical protein ABJD07_00210 [Gemmatimonadaceae bacterium]
MWTTATAWSAAFLVSCELAGALAAPLAAQGNVRRDCLADTIARLSEGEIGAAWAGRRPGEVWSRLAPLRRQGRWGALADSIAAQFEQAGVTGEIGRRFAIELDSLRIDLGRVERDRDYRLNGGVDTRRFNLSEENDPVERFILFDRAGHADTVEVRDATPQPIRRAICWTAITARIALVAAADSARWRLVDALERRVKRWDNFRDKGYSMFPLELVLNGACTICRPPLEPPRWQVVALHLSPAIELAGQTWNDRARLDVLALEPLGLIRYNADRTWYAGVSAVATFASNAPTGAGVLAHVGQVGTAGYVFRRRDANGKRRDGVLLSLDLYRFISGLPAAFKQDRGAAVQLLEQCAGAMTKSACAAPANP